MVAEHTNAVKGEYLELLGHYVPSMKPKQFDIKKDRVEYWLSKGAKPSDSMATLLKRNGFADMDKYIGPRDKKRTPKKADANAAAVPAAEPAEAPAA